MQRAPSPNSKPNDSSPASEISDLFGFPPSSDNWCNFDADAEALITEFATGSSSESDDDDHAAGGAGGESATSSGAHDAQQSSSTKDTLTQQQHRVRGKHGKLKKMSTKYRHQEESEREEAIVLLGSTGAPGASKHLRALKKETKKQARAAAKQSRVNRFFRPPRLSIEFAFIVLQRDRCMDAVRGVLGLSREHAQHVSDAWVSGRVMQRRDRLVEAYHQSDRALPAQLLRRICSSGLLRLVVMQLTQFRNGPRSREAGIRIVARVAAQHMRVARTPEVRSSLCDL